MSEWYALRVRSRFEKPASLALASKGYTEFLPLYIAVRQWSDRAKQVEQPLFPGYVFCRFDVSDRLLPILTIPGVMSIVSAGRIPVPVSEDEIASIQAAVRSGLPVQPTHSLSVGANVVLERGPLAGLEGIVSVSTNPARTEINRGKSNTCQFIVTVSLLQRSIAVQVDRNWVRLVDSDPQNDSRMDTSDSDDNRSGYVQWQQKSILPNRCEYP